MRRRGLLCCLAATLVACNSGSEQAKPAPTASASAPLAPADPPKALAPLPPARTTGSAVARSPRSDWLFVADEDRRAVRAYPLPLDTARGIEIQLPGPPANIVALDGRALVTVRSTPLDPPDPEAPPGASAGGLLVEIAVEGDHLAMRGQTRVPSDAWGLAVTADGAIALVTSAWARKVTAVDVQQRKTRWSIDVEREPRGVAILPGTSRAYVSHLTSSRLTRLENLASDAPTASPVALPASPLRQPTFVPLNAVLGWSLVLDSTGARLFAPRHALGALGFEAWWGAASVDVLRTATDEPQAPARKQGLPASESRRYVTDPVFSNVPWNPPATFVQPRDAAYRASTKTLLVADEGLAKLVELDATVIDPTLHVRRAVDLAGKPESPSGAPTRCGAPTGIALSADEATAWVFCRSTASLAIVHLGDGAPPPAFTDIATDPLPERAAKGRRLFYDARDRVVSGGLACSGCHPDGRDDGHVWHEIKPDRLLFSDVSEGKVFVSGAAESSKDGSAVKAGVPWQTPVIAGRVSAPGPYGWLGESKTLEDRLVLGFALHHGRSDGDAQAVARFRAGLLAEFVRTGLVVPARDVVPESPIEARGRALFEDPATRCSTCHERGRSYTDRAPYPMKRPARAAFEEEPSAAFKTPSLLFVGGSEPFFHDGGSSTLEDLVEKKGDRMGKTSQLSSADRAALVAFLRRL
jgi:cytochrome c peroxidase